jgi:cell division protein FtsL
MIKLGLEITMVVAIVVGYITYDHYKTIKEDGKQQEINETIIDQDAYIHELQAQLARDDAIIHIMEDGASRKQAEHVVDAASAYGVDLK